MPHALVSSPSFTPYLRLPTSASLHLRTGAKIPRLYLSFSGARHGDSFSTLSCGGRGDVSEIHVLYLAPIFQCHVVSCPRAPAFSP